MSDWFLADDLSGALDAGAAFHAAGRRVRLVEATDDWWPGTEGEIVGVNTESRNLPPAAAAARVAATLAHASARGARLVCVQSQPVFPPSFGIQVGRQN